MLYQCKRANFSFILLKHEDKWHMQPVIYIHLSIKWQLHATCMASYFEARMLHACPAAPVQLSTFFTSVHYPMHYIL